MVGPAITIQGVLPSHSQPQSEKEQLDGMLRQEAAAHHATRMELMVAEHRTREAALQLSAQVCVWACGGDEAAQNRGDEHDD